MGAPFYMLRPCLSNAVEEQSMNGFEFWPKRWLREGGQSRDLVNLRFSLFVGDYR